MPTAEASGALPKTSATSKSTRPVQRRRQSQPKLPVHSIKDRHEIRAAFGERYYIDEQGKVIRKCVHARLRSFEATKIPKKSSASEFTRTKKIELDQKCYGLKARLAGQATEEIRRRNGPFNLSEAAARLGLSYSTTRRLLKDDPDVERFSGTTGKAFFPGMPLKRFERVRMSWVIPESSIQRVKRKMRGQQIDVA